MEASSCSKQEGVFMETDSRRSLERHFEEYFMSTYSKAFNKRGRVSMIRKERMILRRAEQNLRTSYYTQRGPDVKQRLANLMAVYRAFGMGRFSFRAAKQGKKQDIEVFQ